MINSDPFSLWSDDYHAGQAIQRAQLVKQLAQREHSARRDLNEAMTYYASGQWENDGIEAGRIDTLLNELRRREEDARRLRTQAQDELDTLLTNQNHQQSHSVTARREDMVRQAKPPPQPEEIAPSPLEQFRARYKQQAVPATALKPKKPRGRFR